MLVDTHSHLNFRAYDKDRDEVVKRLQKEGVICLDVGTKYETSKRAVELAEKNQNIYAAIGIHPIHIKQDFLKIRMAADEGAFEPLGEEFEADKYKNLAKSAKVVAIGEIGLDYYYKPKTKSRQELFKQKQKEVFIEQLNLAQELGLPVIIHCRMAHADVLDVLKSKVQNPNVKLNPRLKLCGIIHCFSGNWEEAKKYLEMGFYLGINGIIYKLDLKEVIEKIPLEKILLETDCPYLTPSAAGQERNEPIFVKYIAEEVAKIKNISFEKVAEITTQNAKKLFDI